MSKGMEGLMEPIVNRQVRARLDKYSEILRVTPWKADEVIKQLDIMTRKYAKFPVAVRMISELREEIKMYNKYAN